MQLEGKFPQTLGEKGGGEIIMIPKMIGEKVSSHVSGNRPP